MEQELAYSFHLGSDKNKSRLAKKVAKDNLSGTTSLSNNAIQNAKDLSSQWLLVPRRSADQQRGPGVGSGGREYAALSGPGVPPPYAHDGG